MNLKFYILLNGVKFKRYQYNIMIHITKPLKELLD